jgi:formiminotetrahydrofolate cyclodeaminase
MAGMTEPLWLRGSFQECLAAFAATTPTPGGGSASALAGAVAANLAQMVAGLTLQKKTYEYEGVWPELNPLLQAARSCATELGEAIASDAASYEAVMRAMALPRDDDGQRRARTEALQAALKGATDAPLAVAQACERVAGLSLRLLEIGNRNAMSDAAVGVLLALAGGEGALLNVAINLGGIKDDDFRRTRESSADDLWRVLLERRDSLWPALKTGGMPVPR